jgi:hypothetical protein
MKKNIHFRLTNQFKPNFMNYGKSLSKDAVF